MENRRVALELFLPESEKAQTMGNAIHFWVNIIFSGKKYDKSSQTIIERFDLSLRSFLNTRLEENYKYKCLGLD